MGMGYQEVHVSKITPYTHRTINSPLFFTEFTMYTATSLSQLDTHARPWILDRLGS